jgi:hypothetical protein
VEAIKRAVEVNRRFQFNGLGFTAMPRWKNNLPMRKFNFFIVTLLLSLLPLAAAAEISQTKPAADNPNAAGQKLCETVSLITGVAISPLLGVGAVGAYKYFKATPEEKPNLPWFASPMFWLPAMLLVAACFLKDTAGIAIPTALKKPFDVAETVEHKVSGLVATGAFVPIAASIFQAPAASPHASLAMAGLAAIDLHWLYNALMVPIAMAAFFIVFLASNAINILILLSPFSTVDAALKVFRTAIIGSVAASSFVNPWMGAAWALVVILFSYLIAGWSFRLSHFGVVFIWDFFTGRKGRFKPDAKKNAMFLATKIQKVPARTYGKLSRNDQDELVLNYRPWLVLPPRTLVLPAGQYEAGRGVFYSEILRLDGDSAKTMILLPPRYVGHEEEITRIYNLAGTRDVGLRAAWAWFKSLFTGKTATA